ncbi:hypothetical protein ACN47E_000826 [Coniothyrium glycines]
MVGSHRRMHKTVDGNATRRSLRSGARSVLGDDVPAIFAELLDEVGEDDRPRKKRRTARGRTSANETMRDAPMQDHNETASSAMPVARSTLLPQVSEHAQVQSTATLAIDGDNKAIASAQARVRQTIVDSDESDDSDVEWVDALDDGQHTDDDDNPHEAPMVEGISITLGGTKTKEIEARKKVRRRAITSVDKRLRLDIHKMHILCLLYHVHRRNAWCNDRRVQGALRKILPSRILESLVPDPELTQYSASKRFIDAMNELKIFWSRRFHITARGMYKPRWADAEADIRPASDYHDLDDPMDKDGFRSAAQTLYGSQDIGAQLLCALLRGIGIETRLVCSLQLLPFVSAAERPALQKQNALKDAIVIDPFNKNKQTTNIQAIRSPARSKKLSRLERAMGERHSVLHNTGVAPKKQKAFHMPYPVYWVETYNNAHQKWVPIDPHSTLSVNMPEKLEPPLGFTQNSLVYAVAFDEDYTAKDVTRRYAKFYNAKTRKYRVECTPQGEKWWNQTMHFFRRFDVLDKEQVEDAALARKEAAEGIPKNVQDFRGHPVYVLERHLKQNEVIYPLTQVGKVNCGTGMNPKMEPIYRRNNVHIVRSSDKWYRMGRDVKRGEQPLKHAKPRKSHRSSVGHDIDVEDQEGATGAALYAEYQTKVYVPPPVVRGRVPRNPYGNLDLFVPSMCPAGGLHIRHKLAAKAARLVGVDFADAVTGFSFKGRHGTAVVQGIVVATEYAEAVQATIDGLEYQVEEAEMAARSAESLQSWRRFLIGLRIVQRVNAIEIDGEKGPIKSLQDDISKQDQRLRAEEAAGGFFPDESMSIDVPPQHHESVPIDRHMGGATPEHGGLTKNSLPEVQEQGAPRPIALDRAFSFESAILDSQELRVRHKNSIDACYSSEDDEAGSSFHEESPAIQQAIFDAHVKQHNGPADSNGDFPKEAEVHATEDGSSEHGEGEHAHEPTPGVGDGRSSSSPSSSSSDVGSLPLEDPEDEDADPDWLVY